MRVLIAPDKFAGTLTAVESAEAIAEGWSRHAPEDRLDLAPAMARMMLASGRELIAQAECVVPVPLHRWRLWRRRFNQAALLGRPIAKAAALPFRPGALARVGPAARQAPRSVRRLAHEQHLPVAHDETTGRADDRQIVLRSRFHASRQVARAAARRSCSRSTRRPAATACPGDAFAAS